MNKRQNILVQRRKNQIRNRLIIIGLVIAGAALIMFALILPGVNLTQTANATLTAVYADPVVATPLAFTGKVDRNNLGDPNAPVKVVAYEDFRCSACKAYSQEVEPVIIQNYVQAGEVYYSYEFYLVVDINDGTGASQRAANAALCAADQNKFWPYHDTLYANQVTESPDLFTDSRLAEMAQNVGLDMNAFSQCYQARKFDPEIANSIKNAGKLNINSTPSIFVNGVLLENWSQAPQAIDGALAGG